MMTEEDVRQEVIMDQLIALKEKNYEKYKQIERDFTYIMYPTTQNTGLTHNGGQK